MRSSTTPDPPEKETKQTSIENGPHVDLAFLAHAATAEHATRPLQAAATNWRVFFWCGFVSIGALLYGYDIQVAGGLVGIPQFRTDFGFIYKDQPVLPALWQSAFNSVSSIGCMFGSLSLGWLSDRLGRRCTIAVACIISIVGILFQFLSPKHANEVLLVGKLVNGFAFGMHLSCASSYCAEISPLALRSTTTASVSLWIIFGLFMSNGVLRGSGNWTTVYAYRLPFAVQWIFPVILLIGLPFAPESPWWLVREGRYTDSEKVIVQLGGSMADAKLTRHQIQETIKLEDTYAMTSTYLDCFKGENLRRTVVAMTVFVLQQCAGVSFVLGYSTYFFELAGLGTTKAINIGLAGSAIGVVGNLLFFYIVNRFRRRVIFSWGMVTCSVILLSIGFIWIRNTNQNARWAMSALTIVYNFVYEASIGPLAYVIFAEVSSAKLRSKTVGIGICTNSLCAMLSNIVIPYLINPNEANLGGYIGFIYGWLSVVGTVWAYFFIPETKGRTVDELDLLFEKHISARRFGTYNLYEDRDVNFDV